MTSAKDTMAKIIEEQSEHASYEEVLRELAFAWMIDRGLADSDKGRTMSNEELARRLPKR